MITEAAVDAGLAVVYDEGGVPYGPARVQDYLGDAMFHEAPPEALAELKAADERANRMNRQWMRRILEAARAADRERTIAYRIGDQMYDPRDVSIVYQVT